MHIDFGNNIKVVIGGDPIGRQWQGSDGTGGRAVLLEFLSFLTSRRERSVVWWADLVIASIPTSSSSALPSPCMYTSSCCPLPSLTHAPPHCLFLQYTRILLRARSAGSPTSRPGGAPRGSAPCLLAGEPLASWGRGKGAEDALQDEVILSTGSL